MKIKKSEKKRPELLKQADKSRLAKFKLKSVKKKSLKNKETKGIGLNQHISSLDNTKISFLKSPSGTVQCLELATQHNKHTLRSSFHDLDSSSRINTTKTKKRLKPRRRNVLKQKSGEEQLSTLTQSKSIVKMTIGENVNIGNNIFGLPEFSDRKKKDSNSSFLDRLIFTGREVNELSAEKASTGKLPAQSDLIISMGNSHVNRTPSTYGTQSSISNKDGIENKTDNNSHKGPVCSIVTTSNGQNSVVFFYELECSKYLVLMKPESRIFVIGTLEIQLLTGSLEVFGYNLHKVDQRVLIFSLYGSSHIFLKAKDKTSFSEQNNYQALCEKLVSLGLPEVSSSKVAKKAENGILFTVTRPKTDESTTVWPQLFEHHSSFALFPPTNLFLDGSRPCHLVERKTFCLFEKNLQELGLKEFFEVNDWSNIEQDVIDTDGPKSVICGGKSVGKSSFLRYLVNKCLFKWKQVLVLDFDLGQCEFTVPGCISLTLVDEPLLGPNYSHLTTPKRCVFLGEVDVTKCPKNYIDGCKSLIDFARDNYADNPWIINTMGFTKGFGVNLACGIINYVKPTHVVQIQSKDRKLNFPSVLEPKYVNCLKHSAFDVDNITMDYQLYVIPSGAEQAGFVSKSRGISPPESRNLVILSYFSKILDSNMSNFSQVTPYWINMEKLDLLTTNKYDLTKAQVAATMNGNMVALCHQSKSDEFSNCLGFGIVRAIDWQKEIIFVITPLHPSALSKVNCLVKGNIGLADSLYYNQGDLVTGHTPYLALTSGGSTARFAKRDYRNLPVGQRGSKHH